MVSTLSGYKNEIIDSIIDGYNIAINGYTEEEKKKKSMLIETVKATIINALAFSVIEKTQIYTYLINNFNDYSIKNNLNITINLNLFTPKNSTVHSDEFFSVIDSFLKRRSNKYDIYFYDNIYTPKFEPNFLDLNKLLPKEHINLYKSVENYESYSYNNKLVGLPVIINYSALYSNIELLNKYNKEIPKTWDELLETGKYILKQEKIKNNTNIVIFNGLFTDNEAGSTTIIEFLHSYRDAINDPFPNFKSPNAVNALKMMKKLKNELSSDYVFQQNIENTFSDLLNGTGLFLKFNYLNLPVNKVYKATILPGHKNGISSTIVGGYNIGINSYLLKEKEEDAVKAVMYMTSKDIQRKLIIEHNCFSGINNLYNEDEVCKNKEELCEIYKNAQPIMRPTSKTNDYNKYSEKIRYYVYKYLYGNDIVDPAKMLRKIDDITRIYYISISSKDSISGKIIAIVYILLSIIILSSSIFIFIKKYNYNFSFLSKDFWILSLLGYILLIYTSFVDLERVTPLRCHLKFFLQFMSFTIVYIPIFHKLISNYPEENKISIWVKSHRYIFLSIFIFLDILINGLIFMQPYTVKTVVTIDSSKNFQKCKVDGLFSKTVIIIMYTFKVVIIIWSCILLFAEWNLKSTIFDIRSCTAMYSLNINCMV
ncbi:periplasmic binding protein-like II [Neocallimastix sp. 'constans']